MRTDGEAIRQIVLGASPPLGAGSIVGRYIIVSLLGRGGMGVVYKAYDPELDRTVALKLVGLSGADGGQRLLREAKALARFSHPNVVAVYDVGAIDGDVFVAMEFVAGPTLRQWLSEAPRGSRDILDVFRAAGAGLAAAHRAGIVHRDFKPDNVIIGDDGRVRVLDFGLARSHQEAGSALADGTLSPYTDGSALAGTPSYMAPEQDARGTIGPVADQFSFCVALYEALCGQHPFAGQTYAELRRERFSGRVRTPRVQPGIPARVRSALLLGLRPAPCDRHADMTALLAQLRTPPRLARARMLVIVGAFAAVGAGWAVHRSPAPGGVCDRAGQPVDAIWNGSVRGALSAAIAGTKHPRASEIVTSVAHSIDTWARQWTDQRIDVCKQSRNDAPTERRQVAADAQQCLDRRLGELDARLYVFTHAPSLPLVEEAADQFAEMAMPRSCAELPPRPSTNDNAVAEPIMRDIMRGRLAQSNGDLVEAESILRSAVERARSAKASPLALALLSLGQDEAALGKQDAARTTLREAVRAATALKDDAMVADAWIAIVGLAFRDRRFDAPLEQAIFAAELAVVRAPSDEARRANLEYTVGSIRAMQDDFDPAIDQLGRAIEDFRRAGAVKYKLDIGAAQNTLGLVYMDRGDFALAELQYDLALEASRQLGPENTMTATIVGNIAYLDHLEGRFAEAEAKYQRALAMLDSADPMVGETAFGLAYLYVETDRCAEASAWLERAERSIAAIDDHSPALAMPLVGKGRCALARGEIREAVAVLTRALDRTATSQLPPRRQAQVEFALARALWRDGRDRPRALSLAKQARERFAHLGGARQELGEVERFVAAASP